MQCLRQADRIVSTAAPVRKPPLDLSGFPGIWKSSDAGTRGIPKLALEVRADGLSARVFGAGDGGAIRWGEAALTGVYSDGVAASRGAGFSAHYDFGFMAAHLQGQLKLGVLVLGSYSSFRDGSGRRGYFSREFLAVDPRAEPEQGGAADVGTDGLLRLLDRDFGALADRGAVDPVTILGRWRNASSGARGIAEIVLEPRAGEVVLRVGGVGESGLVDWGETRAEAFACVEEDDCASACALAAYDFGFMRTELQVRQNKGILAVTTFNLFRDDSGRSDYLTRELFYRTS